MARTSSAQGAEFGARTLVLLRFCSKEPAMTPAKVRTCLWFDGKAEEAAHFYVSLISGSRIDHIFRPTPNGPALTVAFTLAGTPYVALNGGPHFTFTEAASISVTTQDQDETDRMWSALTADGGQESRCGWLKDKFGLSWQIVPARLPELLTDPDPQRSKRAMEAMMQMSKIDITRLEAATDGR
jgi:predicted 3-demethylubiquinone-9 3-methyltransferase (glyoxalase superfamily)